MNRRTLLLVLVLVAAMWVPATAAAVGGDICDLNGDGRGDFLNGNPAAAVDGLDNAGEFTIRYSKASGVPASPDLTVSRSTPGVKGAAMAEGDFGWSGSCGDFNGDGFDDLAISSPGDSVGGFADAGSVNVLPGSATGLDTGPDQLWHQDRPGVKDKAAAGERLGETLKTGDFNGDGYDDLAIGVSLEVVGGMIGAGAVNVLYGSRDGLTAGPDDFWHQNRKGIKGNAGTDDGFGSHLNAGDFNGDGFDDLVIGVPRETVSGESDAGAINLIFGSASGLSSGPDEYWHQDRKGIKEVAETGDGFGARTAVGDFNNDGRDDLAIGVPMEDRAAIDDGVVHVIPGSSGGLDKGPDELWHQDRAGIKSKSAVGEFFGFSVAAGDFDNDGHDDLAVGVPGETVDGLERAGALHVIPGSASGLDSGPDQFWHQEKPGVNSAAAADEWFGVGALSRNYNGDAFDDLVISVTDSCRGYIMYGGSGGLSTSGDQCVPAP